MTCHQPGRVLARVVGPDDVALGHARRRFGDHSPEGVTRRTLLIGGTSVAPNTFALGIDEGSDVMVVHRLVARKAADEEGR